MATGADATRIHMLIGLSVLLVVGGCGSTESGMIEGALVSTAVREACTATMSESEMLAAIAAARIDQFNGYSKAEELAIARDSCLAAPLGGESSSSECLACKTAILDEVFGL